MQTPWNHCRGTPNYDNTKYPQEENIKKDGWVIYVKITFLVSLQYLRSMLAQYFQ